MNGQLYLAQAIIQAKDATIQAQGENILQLQRGTVFTQALQQDTGDVQDKEDLLNGIVSLKPLEVPGADINLPEIFRKLRGKFKKGKP